MKARLSSRAFVVVYTLGMLYVLLSIDWRGRKPLVPPKVVAQATAAGAWSAGAARVDLAPALPATVAGYPPPRAVAQEAGPLSARAVALRVGDLEVAVASAEVLEIPARVARQVRERARALGLKDAVVSATHTHSSFGGYDRNLLVQIAATGGYDAAREAALVAGLSEAIAAAHRALRPARVRVAQAPLEGVTYNRAAEGSPTDAVLTAVAIDGEDGTPIARVAAFGSHATVNRRGEARLDGDWPGRAMQALEKAGGVGILLQGAMGDTSSDPPAGEGEAVDRMGARVAEEALAALAAAPEAAPRLSFASVEVGLPRAEADAAVPRLVSVPVANVLHAAAPRKAEIAILRLPGLAAVFVPAEPTSPAAKAWREALAPALAPGERLAFVAFAQGYVGYVETAEAVKKGTGEAKRALFAPELADQFGAGIAQGLQATK